MECGQPMRLGRLSNQAHSGLFRRAAALLMIAAETGRNDIIPTLLSTERNRHDVIEGKVLGRKLLPAVLTRIIVTRVNVGARELHTIEVLDAHIFKKPDD